MADAIEPFDFWIKFNEAAGSEFTYYDENCFVPDNLVEDVLDTFDVPHNFVPGTALPNLDIKQMGAYQVMKLSLLHKSVQEGKFYELYVDEEGEVNFYELGDGNISSNIDKYYEIQTQQFREICTGVMITGAKPLTQRKETEFKFIWDNVDRDVYDASWMSTNCMYNEFSKYTTIVFNDPHLEVGWKDGIDNFYEVASPWENLMGYARWIDWPDSKNSPDTTVQRTSQAKIPILVTGDKNNKSYNAKLGTLFTRPNHSALEDDDSDCFDSKDGETADYKLGIKIPIPENFRYETIRDGEPKDKLIDIEAVYIVGREINSLKGLPNSDNNAVKVGPTANEADIEISIEDSQDKVFKLTAGKHYQIAYDQDTATTYEAPDAYIVFANNCRNSDPAGFGTNALFKIHPSCSYYKEVGDTLQIGTVLPTGGVSGYLVKQVFAIISLETPSIIVFDPRVKETDANGKSKSRQIADALIYKLAPLISIEAPAPLAFAGPGAQGGEIIDQTDAQKDSDPTEPQNFSETNLERRRMQLAGGSGLSLTFSFIDNEEELKDLAAILYGQMNHGVGVVSNYVCGPDSTPRLGMKGEDDGVVVNSISYNYTDSNAYTISVTTGPRQIGTLTEIGAQPAYKMTEEMSFKGTILEDLGNHIYYKVQADGLKDYVLAINCVAEVLRVGDKVQLSVHNIPAEE